MSKSSILVATSFVLAHLLLIAPFVPLSSVLPLSLGALSVTSMATSLILAARWSIVDRMMGGPDKSYLAHRWLGFFALFGALGHWAIADFSGASLIPMLADAGEGAGTVAVFGLIILSSAAFIRAIPYHLWKASHMLMGPIFVLSAFHTFFVASPLALGSVPWIVLAIASTTGLIAWLQTLIRKKAPSKLVTVEHIKSFEGGVDITLRSSTPLPAFLPGQFATLAHNRARAEAHPFTIAGGDETSRRFIIRQAGDWTHQLAQNIQLGDTFRVGANVGRFLPQIHDTRAQQLWVAGGVGITPFLAALDQMQPDDAASITLIYGIQSRASAGGLQDIEAHAARLPQLNLIIFDESQGQRLTPQSLAQIISPMSPTAKLYLCGPQGLKTLAVTSWRSQKMRGKIHHERFDFRGAYALNELLYVGKPIFKMAQKTISRRPRKFATLR